MPTFISESVTLSAASTDDGCVKFNIYGDFSSSANLITTVSSSDFVAGISLTGSEKYNDYVVECLDSSDSVRTTITASFCSASVDEPNQPCDSTKEYNGEKGMPILYVVPLGRATGSVRIDYNALNQPDKFVIDWGDTTVVNTGYVGSVGFQNQLNTALDNEGYDREFITDVRPFFGLQYPGQGFAKFNKTAETPQHVTVRVYAPLDGTLFNLKVSCPDDSDSDFDPGVELTASAPPAGGGSCLTGTTLATGVCSPGQSGQYSEESFTLSEGNEATIRPTGTYYSGFGSYSGITSHPYNRSSFIGTQNITGGQQHAFLLKPNNEIVEWFIMAHDQGSSPGTSRFYPPNYQLTEAGDYKLRVYHLGCDNGNGTMSLYVDSCAEKSNYQTTVNNTLTSISGVGASTAFKVVWNSTGFQSQQQAQNLLKWLTGRSSVGSQIVYTIDSSLRQSGIKVFDSSNVEKGNINFVGTTSAKYFVDGLQTVVQVTGTSGAGDYVASPTPYSQHKFRIK